MRQAALEAMTEGRATQEEFELLRKCFGGERRLNMMAEAAARKRQ